MFVPLVAGAAKTLVVSMLSERVVLRVLVMLSEWTAAISTNLLDDRRVLEMKTKLEADGNSSAACLYYAVNLFLLLEYSWLT